MTLIFDVLNLRCHEHNQLKKSSEQLKIEKCTCENQRKVVTTGVDLKIINFPGGIVTFAVMV